MPESATHFRGLPFGIWLSLFLTYALTLCRHSDVRDSYSVCAAAKDCTVFYRSKSTLCTIWATWLSCAILAQDTDSVSTILRWFLTTYQFQTEVYNLFTISLTATGERKSLDVYHSAANQKYMLRHIKIMDESISGKKRINAAQLTNLGAGADGSREPLVPREMDTGLLMLYGHMLLVGKSYRSALNYYTRAYAVDPESPMVALSIALSYLHTSMQRQSENRHFQALQAFCFLEEYKRLRRKRAEARGGGEARRKELDMEVEYNWGRALQHYGLAHLAVRRYERVLMLGDEVYGEKKSEAVENGGGGGRITEERMGMANGGQDNAPNADADGDVVMDDAPLAPTADYDSGYDDGEEVSAYGDLRYEAAYNLQMVYITSGSEQLAMEVTKRWLVI